MNSGLSGFEAVVVFGCGAHSVVTSTALELVGKAVSGPTPNILNQNLHLPKLPELTKFLCTFKFETHCSKLKLTHDKHELNE